MEQQTEEWLEMRKSHIGASDAIVIMGISPWKTPYDLFQEKMGLIDSSFKSQAMQRGLDLEQEARSRFEQLVGVEVEPKVLINPKIKWQMASLDGMSKDGKTIVEIKCPGREDHKKAVCGKIPEKYYPQLQHQLCVCDLDEMYYFSYDGEKGCTVKVKRDQKYIDELLEKELEFWNCMEAFTPPALTERDFTKRTDLEWKNIAYEWKMVQKSLKEYEKRENELRLQLIKLADGKNSQGSGLKISKVMRKGNIAYEEMPCIEYMKKYGYAESYRKPYSEFWKVSMESV
jgi:putative phage-type endonuclease